MRIGGELGCVLAIRDVRRRCRKEGRRVDSIWVAYRVRGGRMKSLGERRRKHPGGGESGKSIGIKGGGVNMGEVAGHKGLEVIVRVYRTRN